MTTTSTINRLQPPANSPVASNVVRANFNRAADDIDALWAYVTGLVTGVSSFNGRTGDVVLTQTDVTNALGYNPSQHMGNLHWINPTLTPTPISLVPYAEYGFTINRLNNLSVSAGSLTVSFFINGTPITGLTNLVVTTSPQNPAATAANLVSTGDEITMNISAVSGPQNLKFSMLATSTGV